MGTYDAIKAFLTHWSVSLSYEGTRRFMSVLAPHLAAKTLFNEDGTVAIVTCHGQLQKGRGMGNVGWPTPGRQHLPCMVWDLRKSWGEINMFFQTAALRRTLTAPCGLPACRRPPDLEGPEETNFWKVSGISFSFNYRPRIRPIRPFHFFAEHSGTHYEPLCL